MYELSYLQAQNTIQQLEQQILTSIDYSIHLQDSYVSFVERYFITQPSSTCQLLPLLFLIVWNA